MFPGYVYPGTFGDPICDLYEGVPCNVDPSKCCYNEALWCPNGGPHCDRYDRGAYPFGDKAIFADQMAHPDAVSPFPNAIVFNWATIFVMTFGNLGALDLEARCLAGKELIASDHARTELNLILLVSNISAKTPRIARLSFIISGCLVIIVTVPFAYLGSITRYVSFHSLEGSRATAAHSAASCVNQTNSRSVPYGPDSLKSAFNADSCAVQLGVPTCAEWLPDPLAFLKFLTHDLPDIVGGWCLIAILGAGMNAACGSLLAISAVVSHNICRQVNHVFPRFIHNGNLLFACCMATLPLIVLSASIAIFQAGRTAYLLVVAFDISLAGVVVPLLGCFYTKNPSPRAAIVSICAGVTTRIVLEVVLPKDGYLVFPFPGDLFSKWDQRPVHCTLPSLM
jgi:hypothetical protein